MEQPTKAVRYGQVNRDYARQLATTAPEVDGPVWMVNLMKYRDHADYGDGVVSGKSGREADDEYTPTGPLRAIGAEIVFAADVDMQLTGTPKWDRVAIVKYPTRRSFIEMQARPDFQEKHVHKDAGMESTIVMGGIPITMPPTPFAMPQWSEVPHPPTDDDPSVVVVHVIRFAEGGAELAMNDYHRAAAEAAGPHGVRVDGWFGVEGTIVGDGRTWDEIRFNAFPSKAAFMAVLSDPARLEAQKAHRAPAIADTYSMVLRPRINRIAESIANATKA